MTMADMWERMAALVDDTTPSGAELRDHALERAASWRAIPGTVERGECECGTEPAITWDDDGIALGPLCLADLDTIGRRELGNSEENFRG